MKFTSVGRIAGWVALFIASLMPVTAAEKIGVLLKGRSAFWSAMEKGATESAQKLGVEVTIKSPLTESDISVQIQLLNALVAQGVQALVIAPSSKDALAGPVAAAAAKGIKIVIIDSPLEGSSAPFVATNNTDAGTAAGKLLAALVGEGEEVSFLKHSQTSAAATLREASAYAALREARPKVVVSRDIFSGTESGHEKEKAALLLTQHPGAKVIFASGTPGTSAMLQVLTEKKLAGSIKFVGFGFDLNPTVAAAIESGAMHGWVAQLPQEIGAKGVAAAVSLLHGEPVPEKVYCDFLVVTKDNLHDAKVQALLH